MTTDIALLRAINVGGNRMVAMSDLCELVTRLGFKDARSLLQSGNLVFRGSARSSAQVERLLEAETEKAFKFAIDVFVRTATEWKTIIAHNPFPKEARQDPGRLVVVFLKEAPAAARVKALQARIVGPEVVRADGRHAYIVYPDGMGRSRLTGALIEKTLETSGTARNWNTVLKLDAAATAQNKSA